MPVLFASVLFLNALLIFWVQPLFAKMVLPLLGGSPSVWTTCMLFFQAALLAGYAYGHAGIRALGIRRHALLHAVLVWLPLLLLPIAVNHESAASTDMKRVSFNTRTASPPIAEGNNWLKNWPLENASRRPAWISSGTWR